MSGIVIAALVSATVLGLIYASGRKTRTAPGGGRPATKDKAMKTKTDSSQRELPNGTAERRNKSGSWNDPHLGVVAEVYRRARGAATGHEKNEPWNDPKLGVVAEVYGWCRKHR
jgi:hypothetical protein